MKKQQGFILIFTVVLLLVAAMMGLYAMRSTIIQDKMTANINNKTITTNAAEEGASAFYEWAKTRFLNNSWPTSSSDKDSWKGYPIPYINTGTLTANSGTNGYYWINPNANIVGCTTINTNPCWDEVNKQVTVLITGNLIKSSSSGTTILGESVYQIKLAAPGELKLPDMPAPLTLAGNVSSFISASSNNFSIDGNNGKVAIATTDSTSNQKVIDKLKAEDTNGNKKSDNYTGKCASKPCVSDTENMGIWGNANQLMTYINTIKTDKSVKYINGNATNANLDLSKPINIITGNLTQNGNLSDYKGVIIVLGAGNSEIKGGGNTKINGAMYFANIINNSGNYSFGNVGLTINGGGTMGIKYDGSYFGGSSDINGGGYATSTTVLSWSDIL
ncbi:pilus assembly PilX family protein [Acinetobacter terrestris]|uniref:Type 4 fimbrial biogenesis protein PilX N-terminal domain-containing protein n=1 Tax=Acinetobacter terrestris TaxID=2529843 RepID=A0AAW6UXQ3_9GAMM|nr:hypothetical protein [Acinetobacter terrestris]MDK1683669.1 hypothetical protein [Acinetobacter terrestris]